METLSILVARKCNSEEKHALSLNTFQKNNMDMPDDFLNTDEQQNPTTSEGMDPPAIPPSYIEVDEQGKLYCNGRRVKYAWCSEKQATTRVNHSDNPYAVWLQANSKKQIRVTQVSKNPNDCPWSDRTFVGYVYHNSGYATWTLPADNMGF